MNFYDIRLPQEMEMAQDLYIALQGDGLMSLLNTAEHPMLNAVEKIAQQIENECFAVTEKTAPRYYRLFTEVRKRLEYETPIRFFIKADPKPNACAIFAPNEKKHIIVIHSSTLQLLNDDEIRQVIGHEIGHLIIKQGKLAPILSTFGGQIEDNPSLRYKVKLWQQLAELSADRFGFLAVPDLYCRISSSMKFAAGLDPKNLVDDYAIDYEGFINYTEHLLKQFQQSYGVHSEEHPIDALRIQALKIFSQSCFVTKDGLSKDELEKQTANLLNVLYNVAENETEVLKAQFHAAAGILIASCDGQINQDELDYIYTRLSEYQIFPREFFDFVAQHDYVSMFEDAVNGLLMQDADNQALKERILHRLIQISFADQNLHKSEIELILDIAQNTLGYSRKQAARIFLDIVHEHFMPNPEDVF